MSGGVDGLEEGGTGFFPGDVLFVDSFVLGWGRVVFVWNFFLSCKVLCDSAGLCVG